MDEGDGIGDSSGTFAITNDKEIDPPLEIGLEKTTSSVSAELASLDRRYLIRRPRALQYFERGVLKKSSDKERVSGRFELFFDLLYVALVSTV